HAPTTPPLPLHDALPISRDTYSYLHLPMVAGIVLFALALKQTLGHLGTELDAVPAFGLCIGPAMYLLAHDGMRFRTDRTYNSRRSEEHTSELQSPDHLVC